MEDTDKKIEILENIVKVALATQEKYKSTIAILEENKYPNKEQILTLKELLQKNIEHYNDSVRMLEELRATNEKNQ